MEKILKDKVAIVTGSGQGIGKEHALLLAKYGAKVVINDLNESAAQNVVDEILEFGGNAILNLNNIASFEGAQQMVDFALENYGDVNILINNAGILRDAMSFNMTEEEFMSVLNVHLLGHFAPSHFVGQYWRQKGKAGEEVYGRIINTTSESGLFSNVGQANYAAAKAGIASMSIVLAKELERFGVTVNSIAPRARTQMTESIPGAADLMQPQEGEFDVWNAGNISPLVVFLCSPAAGDITGQTFAIFGGDIYRFHPYTVANKISKDQRWDVEELNEKINDLFEDSNQKGIIPNPDGF